MLDFMEENKSPEWAAVCVKLLQGPIYKNSSNDATWALLESWQSDISRYFDVIGVKVVIENADGYAYLAQKEQSGDENSRQNLPKLIKEYPLSVELSFLCVILREALDQFDSSENISSMLVIKESEIRDRIATFLPDSSKSDQTKMYRKLDEYLNRLVELTFLREINSSSENKNENSVRDREFEVRRIIRSKVNAEFLEEFKNLLSQIADEETENNKINVKPVIGKISKEEILDVIHESRER